MKKLTTLVLYPLFFGLLPPLVLLTDNINNLSLWIAYRSLYVFLLVNAIIFLLFYLLLRNWHRAGLVTAFLSFLFFNYRHLLYNIGSLFAGHFLYAAALIATITILGFYVLARLVRKPQALTKGLNFVSLFLVVINFAYISFYDFQDRFSPTASAEPVSPGVSIPGVETGQVKRDVYYIILDAYARSDVLSELYQINNQPFLDELRRRGFIIAAESHSNYSQTLLSLSSSLNMNYLDQIASLPYGSNNRGPLEKLVRDGQVIRFFREQGYTFAALETGYSPVNIHNADVYITRRKQLNEFEEILVNNSFLLFYTKSLFKRLRYEALKEEFAQLETFSRNPGPKFVFAHFLLPHSPFLFDEKGDFREQGQEEMGDGNHFTGTYEDYHSGYRGQLLYANQRVLVLIDTILAQPGPKPIIILQGDHGSGMHLDQQSYENTCVRERLSILNAYFLPGEDGAPEVNLLPASITPVNSFRFLFNRYFQAGMPILEDVSYFSVWDYPYSFQRLSDEELNTRCEPWMGKLEPGK